MTSHLTTAALNRLGRLAVAPMSTEDGMALFDTAQRLDRALALPVRLDARRLRELAADAEIPPLLSGLVRTPLRRTALAGTGSYGNSGTPEFARQLAQASQVQRERLLLDLVLSTTAVVLGHSSGANIAPDRGFLDLGFDSLTAVELRNRLSAAIGLRLPATLLFDYPTPAALSVYLGTELTPKTAASGMSALTALSHLESLLPTELPSEDGDRGRLAARLQALLAQLQSAPGMAAAGNGRNGAHADAGPSDIGNASDEEIFEFIDNDLGIGNP